MEPTGWTPKRIGNALLLGVGGLFVTVNGARAILTQHDEWYRRGRGGPVDGWPAEFGGVVQVVCGLVFLYAGVMIFLGKLKLPR